MSARMWSCGALQGVALLINANPLYDAWTVSMLNLDCTGEGLSSQQSSGHCEIIQMSGSGTPASPNRNPPPSARLHSYAMIALGIEGSANKVGVGIVREDGTILANPRHTCVQPWHTQDYATALFPERPLSMQVYHAAWARLSATTDGAASPGAPPARCCFLRVSWSLSR